MIGTTKLRKSFVVSNKAKNRPYESTIPCLVIYSIGMEASEYP